MLGVNTSSHLSTTIPGMYESIFSSTKVKYFSGSESGKPWWKSQVEEKSKLSAPTMEGSTPPLNLTCT